MPPIVEEPSREVPMTRTIIRGALFTAIAVALSSLFASSPAWAPANDRPEQLTIGPIVWDPPKKNSQADPSGTGKKASPSLSDPKSKTIMQKQMDLKK
jgi:hypothetical protein